VLVVLQGQLGFLGHELPAVGALHGLTALILFTVALYAARGVEIPRRADRVADEELRATV
jgi:hypothetical protein